MNDEYDTTGDKIIFILAGILLWFLVSNSMELLDAMIPIILGL